MPRHLLPCFLLLLTLLQRGHADHDMAEDCREYCLKCGATTSYRTPSFSLQDSLVVSLQVNGNGTFLVAQISLPGSDPPTHIAVNTSVVTAVVDGDKERKQLRLSSPRPPFSWLTLVLASTGQDSLLVYSPADRINVISLNISHDSLAFVSSNTETHLAFNCLTGCLIRDASSSVVRGTAELHPPFTMYLKRLSANPILVLTPTRGENKTVNVSKWKQDTWYRARILVAEKDRQKRQKQQEPQQGEDGVQEVDIWVTSGTYKLTQLKGLDFTLHCPPKELLNTSVSIDIPEKVNNNTEETLTPTPDGGTEGGEGSEAEEKTERGRAGAGQVTAWVMAGLALFLVMILALALCTKTARNSQPHYVQDSQPSVGIVYCKKAAREPEEDSEPESPNELKVPTYRKSLNCHVKDY